MLQCLSLKSSSSTSTSSAAAGGPNFQSHRPGAPHKPSKSQGTSTEGTPTTTAVSSGQQSPSVILTREYTLALQSNSYNEIWSKIHVVHHDRHSEVEESEEELEVENHHRQQLLLGQVLQPNRECVQEALGHAKPNTLTRLVSEYLDQSENTTHLCLLLHRSVYRARDLYAPLHQLLDDVFDSLDSQSLNLSQSQCSQALDVFLLFDRHDNPFPSRDSHNFNDMRSCFSKLKQQLDRRLRTSRSRIRLLRRASVGSAICVIGTAVGVVVSAAAITVHALAALVLCTAFPNPYRRMTEKEVAHMKQLDAAAMGACVLNNDLDTIDRLVDRLHTEVDGDKLLIRLGLERGRDKHPLQEVVKQLRKNHHNFLHLLNELEESICLCFNTVNRARSMLLQEICRLNNVQRLQAEAGSPLSS